MNHPLAYFKATINDDIKYIHKQAACYLLTDEKSQKSNDRLLRVQQINKKVDCVFFFI